MKTSYYVKGTGYIVGYTPIKEQAIQAAQIRAKQSRKPVEVVAEFADGRKRSILVHPSGTIEKLWKEM